MGEPKLRFKADDGSDFPDWEEMTLGDVGSVAMCKRVFKEQTCEVGDVPFFKIGTFGGAPDAYISQSLFDELKSKYAYPKVGTILLSASGTIGRQVEYKGEDAYYQDSNIVWLEHDDTVLDSYLKQFYSVVKWQGLEGSTIKRLYNKTILDTPFYRPSLPEQRKIGDFLSAVDAVIAAQQAEVDAWEQRKKGVMQKLFSQEVRFKADDGSDFPAWEEKVTEQLCLRMIGGGTPSTDDPSNYDGETSWISSSDLDENDIYTIRRTRFITDEAISNSATKRVKANSIVVVLRVGVGKVAISRCETCTSQDFISLEDVQGDICFIAYMLSEAMRREALQTQGTSIKGVTSKRFRSLVHMMPASIDEQRKIADCLSSMDEVIQKSKDELAKWQELKKGLLQQMFV
jgi:type I restriction enzyme S subunit